MRLNSLPRRLLRAWHKVRPPCMAAVTHLAGLHDPVEVLTDAWGVPHIYARHDDDLFFAQGFVNARDRLFQMDYNRRAAAGRLCELVGRRPVPWGDLTVHLKNRTTFDVDVLLRTFRLEASAKAALEIHSPRARRALAAYTAGVNAWIAKGRRSLEHRLLNADVRPWTDADSLLMFKAIAFELNFGWRSVLYGHMLESAGLPEAVARKFYPFPRPDDAPIVDSPWRGPLRELAATRNAAETALGWGNASGVGSNSFAVDGERSATGSALLANDTHLLMTCPTPWYEVGLHGGSFDAHGFALAGVPGLGLGQTPHHAWSITAGMVQDLDLFAEKINPEDPTQVLTPQGYAPLASVTEQVDVRGEKPVAITVQSSRHGPLLHTFAAGPEHQKLSVCWTGLQPGRELDALFTLATAADFDACMDAAQYQVCPTYSITYAGADGRIAYVLAGLLPKRRRDTPLRPLEGWTDAWDWQGFVPWQENPRSVDPPSGILVTANNRITHADAPHNLGDLFEPAWRFDRITARLLAASKGGVTLSDMASVQVDTYSAYGLEARAAFFPCVGGVEGLVPGDAPDAAFLRKAAQLWADWDGDTGLNAAGCILGLPVVVDTGREVVRRLAGDDAAWGFVELGSMVGPSIVQLPTLADTLLPHGVDLAEIIRAMFVKHARSARDQQGDEPTTWQWRHCHQLTLRHRLHNSPVEWLFSLGPEPAPGGPDTVCRGDFDSGQGFNMRVGAAVRVVYDTQDVDACRSALPGGQSGARLSPHYDDQLQMYLEGRLKDAPFSRQRLWKARHEEFLPT